MKFESFSIEEKSLSHKLIRAIDDPGAWGSVLETIVDITGAKGAIITLRDKETCQIVNDVDIERKFHSPLVRGFSTDDIAHYLTNLRTIDPWAEFQRRYYPHRPIQMSRVCPPDAVPDQRFFDWLAGVGFTDSIVFELDRMAGYWTALNLFLPSGTGKTAETAMAFANAYCDLLRQAWTASQSMSKARQSRSALLQRAAGTGTAVCIVGANGEFLDGNDLFYRLLSSGSCRLSGASQKLSFSYGVTVLGLDTWEQHGFLRHDGDDMPIVMLASPITPDPLFQGKRETLWLLTVTNSVSAPYKNPAKDLAALTRQERNLYLQIVGGKSVAEAGQAIGLKRSRTFEVWDGIKFKLGIRTAHELRL